MWDEIRLTSPDEEPLWELFHENSKLGRFSGGPSEEETLEWMNALWESLPYSGYPAVDLPREHAPFRLSLQEAIVSRATARELSRRGLTMQELTTLLFAGYGVTRDERDNGFPRRFRTVPSGGALYPLEIYFHTTCVDGLKPGLYHYNPAENRVRLLRERDHTAEIASAMAYGEIPAQASLMIFLTAAFERSTHKYAERGYRFVLLEAGHVAQNINLAAAGLDLASINVGGFYDREIDSFLDLDGLAQSTLYLIGVGKGLEAAQRG